MYYKKKNFAHSSTYPRRKAYLAPKIGPLGLAPKKIGEDIAKETAKEWKGLRLTVKLTVRNRQAKVPVVPSAAALVIKALKEPERDRKKVKNTKHNRNISFDDMVEITRIMRPKSIAKERDCEGDFGLRKPHSTMKYSGRKMLALKKERASDFLDAFLKS
ncbi:unnamed protein product [Eruca vesicaria subsp. sativa]|uniref:Uncharacterized protein n=1 Tax=Eruca vesicaria subsp. sativa TaxID=29727 RepID=A0ABC8J6M7_ERUVS|nr:unnamed protein product [Eruca vesicaria subsp. sativa]